MTAKQQRKRERFDRGVARDAGDYLQSIPVASIIPVAENVTWDQEPELLCSYNWQASIDTNTIFGKSRLEMLARGGADTRANNFDVRTLRTTTRRQC
tara:strand:- start:4022 stop:4312 length:291 start_codon:yes stop_codon:yes gene_type:complete